MKRRPGSIARADDRRAIVPSKSSGTEYELRISGSPKLIKILDKKIKSDPKTGRVVSLRDEEHSQLQFNLADVQTMVAVANGLIAIGKIAREVYLHFKKNPKEKVRVQTVFKIIEISSADAVKEDTLKRLLESAVKP